jgi:regulatory protein
MELKRKLLSKNYTQNTIEQAIQKLHQKNYLNDKDFIKCFTTDEMKLKKNGPLLIKKKLIEKGARLEDVDQILNELYDEAMQIKNSQSLIYSKAEKINESNPFKYKQKLVNFLKQKGFSWQVIEYVFSQLKLKDN